MQEIIKILLGIIILVLGIPIGIILAKNTKEELRKGRKWFITLIVICFIGAVWNLIIPNDALLFTFLFIAVVSSMSLKKKHTEEEKRKRK